MARAHLQSSKPPREMAHVSRRPSDQESTTDILRMMTIGLLNRSESQSKMPAWCPVKRPTVPTVYEILTRFRTYPDVSRRTASAVVRRQRTHRPSAMRGRGTTIGPSVAVDELREAEKDGSGDDFDFDADDGTERVPSTATRESLSQQVYLTMCKQLKLAPRRAIMRSIDGKKLDLRNYLLGPDGVRAVCVALVKNTTVTSLSLSDNELRVEGASHVSQLIIGNPFIIELNVANNNLRTLGARYIIEAMRETDNIKILDISGNQLKENDGVIIRNLIEDCRMLKELYASHNLFSENGGMEIGEAISMYDTLEVLDLSWNHLRLKGAKAIARGLGNSNSLKKLNLAWNGFHLDGSKELAKALESNTTLEELDLSANRIDTPCLQELAKGLKSNSTLKVLKLAKNPITASGALFLVQTIYDLKSSGIQELDLGDQAVEPNFLAVLKQLQFEREVKVKYGAILWQEVDNRDYEQELLNENPLVVLIQFSFLLDTELVKLFSAMDEKGQAILTRAEMKKGLQEASMPLSDRAMEHFVAKLDINGDGEIRYGRLLGEYQQLKRKVADPVVVARGQPSKVQVTEQSEVTRVRAKLRRLMRIQERQRQQAETSNITFVEPPPAETVEQAVSSGDMTTRSRKQVVIAPPPFSAGDDRSPGDHLG